MKVRLETAQGVMLHEQEVIFAGRMPDLIRWGGNCFAHHFTHFPHGKTTYRLILVYDMPEPLPPEVLGSCDTQ